MDRQPVASSLIQSVGYDVASSILEVEFVGTRRIYEYYDLPMSVYLELISAESVGSYFNEFIRDLYPAREVR